MTTLGSYTLGYLGILVASLFFGSNFVPVKKYPTGDGLSYVWVFSSGVLTVAFCTVFITGEVIFIPIGLFSGTLWAMGNFCIVPIIQLIGLGLGSLAWSGMSITVAFFCGKFGFFGLVKDTVKHNPENWGGIFCILVALVVFFFIKPDLQEKETGYIPIGNEKDEEGTEIPEKKLIDFIPKKSQPLAGFILALGSGVLFGVNIVPMKLWVQDQPKTPEVLAFVFSHFMGIYLFSTLVYIIYNLVKRPPQIFPQTILPSFISGFLWGVAQCGLMVATQILGFTVGFPIGSTGPLVVASLLSVIVFREIRGTRNLLLLLLSFVFLIVGMGLLTYSLA